ncbi:MAG: hypothetical protein E3J72_17030 [Planctomycetota bacterium]|nr:MAG: hypothetical protein E3J72_17030 [Planctomycetota bacterium]
MKAGNLIADHNILPLHSNGLFSGSPLSQSLVTAKLTEEHKDVVRRFAHLRLNRGIPCDTVMNLFECHVQAQPSASQLFYTHVLMPVIEFDESLLAAIENCLDSGHSHYVVLDKNREIIDYKIIPDGNDMI